MPPKIVFTSIEDDILRQIFDLRNQNNWSNVEIERQFRQRSSRSITYKTLSARLNFNKNAVNIDNQPSDNNIKNEIINVNSLNHQVSTIDQPECTADITSDIEHSLSILKVDESNSSSDNNDEIISTRSNEQTNITNDETAIVRPRGRPKGRPVGSRKKKTPLTVQGEIRREKAKRLKRNEKTKIRRANETPDETSNRVTLEAQRQRERRANENIEQANNRNKKDAQRQKEKRANETPEEHERRLQQQRDYRVRIRKNKAEEKLN